MHLSYYNMEFNPFNKSIETKYKYETKDFKLMRNRLEYIKENPGIALFTGNAGLGKTFTIREFLSSLNPNLYKTIYVSMSSVTVLEFYREIAYSLGIEPAFKKIDIFNQIQDNIVDYVKNKKIKVIICIDEAQYLKTDIINDLKMLMNFEMDSKNYFSLILIGQPSLNNILNRTLHDALRQRITVSYNMVGLSKDEAFDYIDTRLKLVHSNDGVFNQQAKEAIWNSCNGSVRLINNIVEKSLIIGYKKQSNIIDSEIIMESVNELALG